MGRMKLLVIICVIISALIFLSSCGMNSSKPDYLLEGARDNGFIAAYRSYLAIQGDTIKKISKRKYEKSVYTDKEYEHRRTTYYSIDAKVTSEDISNWEFTQNQYNDKVYDKQTLIDRISAMDLHYEGKLYILITEFDDYEIFDVSNVDDINTILGEKYAAFHNGSMLTMDGDPDLSSIRSVYKYKGQ